MLVVQRVVGLITMKPTTAGDGSRGIGVGRGWGAGGGVTFTLVYRAVGLIRMKPTPARDDMCACTMGGSIQVDGGGV